MSAPSTPSADALRERLGAATLRDAARLRRRLDKTVRLRNGAARRKGLADLDRQLLRSEQTVAARSAAVPSIRYPDLPISASRDELAAAIAANQVVVVAGETGSGKTTQLPKICLELGRGVRGTIGHTQPRRLAARTVAQRIADELGTPLGDVVGYTVRFTDQVSDRTLVRLMTDGILLAEIQRDPQLLRYDTLIIDEAHERSLNIDFLLGYLVRLLPQRPDLKLIITSATIDPQRFAAHFGDAPVIEVSGRTYPVEVRYRPLVDLGEEADDDDLPVATIRDQTEGIIDAVRELCAEGPGDILVFLSGEREIRDTAEALRALNLPATEILPLYARLASADQQRVFAATRGLRRIVLSTNVAETSLTVPGIRYVVDPGTARISRFSRRTKVQRLPIEPVSQASANQRAGRCGRVAAGVCIRLYTEQDYQARPRFTDPEILRTNLASVILQMAAARLGDMEDFPFLDPPDKRSVRDGMAVLHELGALDDAGALTPLGRRLAQLPVDPRIGRMILQAGEEGCVRELLVLAAALTIPDPRERPSDQQAQADQKHARFRDESSDFTAYLNLWAYLHQQRKERSGNQFRKMCREEFLNYVRVREWQDLTGQLRSIAASLDLVENDEPAAPERVHAALLAGLLSHVGLRIGEAREYQGARGARFVLAPGSTLANRPPRWVMAAELAETNRLYARTNARVDPDLVERLAAHLVARTYSEPHWDARRGAVMAFERVTLFGLPLVARRRVGYGTVDPAEARDLFIRHALVEGDWETRHRFFAANRDLLDEAAEVEERVRRRGVVIGDEELFAFYDKRIPPHVVSARHFDAWWKKARHTDPDLLTLRLADVVADDLAAAAVSDDAHPDEWQLDDLHLPVSYRFEPGAADDGVTVHVPLDVLARVDPDGFAWQVPALRLELVTALIKSLPKALRVHFIPAPDTARQVLAAIEPGQEPLLAAMQRELHRRSGVLVPIDAFDLTKVPPNLLVTFAVENDKNTVLAKGKDLRALQAELLQPSQAAVRDALAPSFEFADRSGLRDWPADLDELPKVVELQRGGHLVRGFPAFVDDGSEVSVRVLSPEQVQQAAMRAGVRRLLRLSLPAPGRAVREALTPRDRLVLGGTPGLAMADLLDDCADAAVDALISGTLPWTRKAYEALRDQVAPAFVDRTKRSAVQAGEVLTAAHEVRAQLARLDKTPTAAEAVRDVRRQLDALLPPRFVTAAGAQRLPDLLRYLKAARLRLEKLPHEAAVDRAKMQRVAQVQQAYDQLVAALPPVRTQADDVTDVRWLIEELRVSVFAQQVGTARSVSEQRIYRALDAVRP